MSTETVDPHRAHNRNMMVIATLSAIVLLLFSVSAYLYSIAPPASPPRLLIPSSRSTASDLSTHPAPYLQVQSNNAYSVVVLAGGKRVEVRWLVAMAVGAVVAAMALAVGVAALLIRFHGNIDHAEDQTLVDTADAEQQEQVDLTSKILGTLSVVFMIATMVILGLLIHMTGWCREKSRRPFKEQGLPYQSPTTIRQKSIDSVIGNVLDQDNLASLTPELIEVEKSALDPVSSEEIHGSGEECRLGADDKSDQDDASKSTTIPVTDDNPNVDF